MFSRIGILVLEIVGVLMAGLLIAVLALGWRLTSGPISLDFARGLLEDALAPRDQPITVEIGEPVLTWKGWTRVFDVTINEVRVSGYDGALDAWAPSVQVRLSVQALAEGIAAPVRITVNQPSIHVDFARDAQAGGAAVDSAWVSEIIHQIAGASGDADRLSYLRLVELNDATIEAVRPGEDDPVVLRHLNVRLSRYPGVLRINAGTELARGDKVARAALDLDYDDTVQVITGAARIENLAFSTLTEAVPGLGSRLGWSAPLDADLNFEIGPGWQLRKVTGSVGSQDGDLSLPDLYPDPRTLDSVAFEVAYDATSDRLDFPSWKLRHGDISASGSAQINALLSAPVITAQGSTENFPGDRLMTYWPPTLGVDARGWIERNLSGGTVPKATVDLEVRFDPSGDAPPVLNRVSGDIAFRNVTGSYFRPLPPATEINGQAAYDATKFDIRIDTANLQDLRIENAVIRLLKLDTNDQIAEIETAVRGPLQSALRLLNHKSLDLGRHIKLDTKSVTGLAGTRLRFAFPLLNDLKLAQIDFAASANLDGVGIPDIAAGQALSGGKLTLELDRDSLRIDGTGTVAGARAALTMDEVFTPNARIRTRKYLNGSFKADTIKALGLPEFITLQGPVAVDVETLDLADGTGELTAVLDLRDAQLAIPALKWSKPAKSGGRIRFAVDTRAGRVIRLRSANVLAADLGADLAADFRADTGALERVRFDRLVLGDSMMNGSLVVGGDGRISVVVSGDRLDIDRFLGDDDAPAKAGGTPFDVNARFEEVQVGALPPITGAVMTLRDDGAHARDIRLDGRVGEEPISVVYAAREEARRFQIRARDAGRVLRGFDMLDSIQDGALDITGTTTGRGEQERTQIDLSVTEFGFLKAPVLAQLLNAAFLPGLVDILQGNGIRFEKLSAKIDLTKDRARIVDALAFGSSLGISAEGEVDRNARTVEINGMIVPAYGLSRLIDQIPILGKIITGGEKEGLLAAEYLVGGNLDKPVVTVNPLTALTPGFLRALIRATGEPPPQGTAVPGPGEGPNR